MHSFYAFPHSFLQKIHIFCHIHSSQNAGTYPLLFFSCAPGKQKLPEKMLHPARRTPRPGALPEQSAAAKPDLRVEQSPVPADKLLLIRRCQYREDTVCFRTIDLIDHTLVPVILRFHNSASRQTDAPVVSAQRICCILKNIFFWFF